MFLDAHRTFRGSFSGYERDLLFVNPGPASPRFYDAGYVLGVDFDDDGRAVVAVDIDGDGNLDLALWSLQGLHLIRNTLPPRHFARVRLTATKGLPLALGAIVHVRAGGVTRQDYVKLTDGFQAAVAPEMHFGLGDCTAIESLQVDWPSGAREEWKDLPVDRVLHVREGAAAVEAVPVPRWPEGSRPRVLPSFSLEGEVARLDGTRGRLGATGQATLVNFWAPGCAGCDAEAPELARLAARFGPEVQFAGVCVETKDLEAARAAVGKTAPTWPQFVADEGLLGRFFGTSAPVTTPATFVFDPAGGLRRAFLRPIVEAEVAALLESLRAAGAFGIEYQLLGQGCYERRDYEGAARWWGKMVAAQPRDATAHLRYGLALGRLERHEAAAEAFESAVALDPAFAEAYLNLAAARKLCGHPREAIQVLEKLLTVEGENASTLLILANVALEAGDLDLASASTERAVRAQPRSVDARVIRARVLRRLGRPEEAKKCLEEALALEPGSGPAQRELLDLLQEPKGVEPGVGKEQ